MESLSPAAAVREHFVIGFGLYPISDDQATRVPVEIVDQLKGPRETPALHLHSYVAVERSIRDCSARRQIGD